MNGLLVGPCPVHGGDNPNGFNINVDPSHDWFGRWFCNTRKCHYDYKNDVIGLIKGMIEKNQGKEVSFSYTIEYIENLVKNVNLDGVFRSDEDLIYRVFQTKQNGAICNRNDVINGLQIPCPYFSRREPKFTESAMREFDIGFCGDPTKLMYNRTVFPVYSTNPKHKNSMVGAVGRATQEGQNPKWLNSKGFYSASNLYRYSNAFDRIKETRTAILVEGQGDVIRLWEAGIRNCVGLFKSVLSDEQSILLERASVDKIIIALDNDESGKKGTEMIIKNFKDIFNIFTVKYPKNDMGDMTVEEINTIVKPQIKGLF